MGVRSADSGTILEVRDRTRQGLWLETARPTPRVLDGLPAELDKCARTEGLGNAVVPQIPELIARRLRELIDTDAAGERVNTKGVDNG
jgi:hypothetical protein